MTITVLGPPSADPLDPEAFLGEIGPDSVRVWEAIEQLGLTRHVAQLDTMGYTIVPPDAAGTRQLVGELIERIFDVGERRTGIRPTPAGDVSSNTHGGLGQLLSFLLFEDPLFVDVVLSPVVTAFVTSMLGINATLSSMQAQIKTAGGEDLQLHADNVMVAPPFPSSQQLCNVSINLTPYSVAEGSICFVPGSHKLFRQPSPGEGLDQRVGIEAEPGSLIVFTGNTWHGAFARRASGVRISMLMQFARPHIRPFEAYGEHVTDEMLARHGERFRRLMGKHVYYGWGTDGPQYDGWVPTVGAHPYV